MLVRPCGKGATLAKADASWMNICRPFLQAVYRLPPGTRDDLKELCGLRDLVLPSAADQCLVHSPVHTAASQGRAAEMYADSSSPAVVQMLRT